MIDLKYLKELGWSKELIEATQKTSETLNKSELKLPNFPGIVMFDQRNVDTTSIDLSHIPPTGSNHLYVKR